MLLQRESLDLPMTVVGVFLLSVAPPFVLFVSGTAGPVVTFAVLCAILTVSVFAIFWSRVLTKISLREEKLTVESPLRKREFKIPEDLVVQHGHSGVRIISKSGWPHFLFDPTKFRLNKEQQLVFHRMITGTENRPNQPPQTTATSGRF